jgi:hypothetical protein
MAKAKPLSRFLTPLYCEACEWVHAVSADCSPSRFNTAPTYYRDADGDWKHIEHPDYGLKIDIVTGHLVKCAPAEDEMVAKDPIREAAAPYFPEIDEDYPWVKVCACHRHIRTL